MSKAGKYTVIGLFVFWCLFVIVVTGIERFSAPHDQDTRQLFSSEQGAEMKITKRTMVPRLMGLSRIVRLEQSTEILSYALRNFDDVKISEEEMHKFIRSESEFVLVTFASLGIGALPQDLYDELRVQAHLLTPLNKDRMKKVVDGLQVATRELRASYDLSSMSAEEMFKKP